MRIFILLLFISCQTQDCSEIKYNKRQKLSFLNEKLFTGDCESYYSRGKLKSKQSYVNGKDNGIWIFYYPDGKIQTEGEFKGGKRVGEWNYYFKNGKVYKTNLYDSNGERIGTWKEYNPKGEIVLEEKF